jgi:hypothetical protein
MAIAVSEEIGGISICQQRQIERNFTPQNISPRDRRNFVWTLIMKRLISKKWRVTLISLLFARLTLNNWRAKLISLILATMLWYLIKKNLETTTTSEPVRRPTATEMR